MTRVFAYCRVSTSEQTTDNQVQEIANAGFSLEAHRVITETISGSIAASERPGFSKLLHRMERGDVLVVTKLDRLGRNALDVRATVDKLSGMGVKVHCLQLGGTDLTSPAGKMVMGVVNAMAEFERDLLIERTQTGLRRAKAEGKTFGRPKALSDDQRKEALRLIHEDGLSIARVAQVLGVSRQTIMRARDDWMSSKPSSAAQSI
jgi:putative DNA-invertase from lambdoid prophage Rac